MEYKVINNQIFEQVHNAVNEIEDKTLDLLIESLEPKKRVFYYGCGRSGIFLSSFANRLLHLGFEIYSLNDITKPKAEAGDIFLVTSGSGETSSVVSFVSKSKNIGMKIIAFSAQQQSSMASLLTADDALVVIPCDSYIDDAIPDIRDLKMPLGTLFELSCLMAYETVTNSLMYHLGESAYALSCRHTNLE
ncbi:hypothetical protein BCU70_05300 [Vibrio sp. 10N.286.49.C2]|uniref:SIS domain-containing protein n=1 Tax=unclassified Vibrio TaxID=2614977 RepID=UPI000C866977|nr:MULTISPECIES: SIS domain-containing protein [unclassified Vibrio]PMH33897.1 hypothetical protein BCU70_05300 [Vibrio sp. 10N.286.49.C2]PMH44155.1 hypothetical protein BCU66_04210 [Vibrio sp. 10N.286.49.B1]PMH80435.1 hypothetical protein BCU58_23670 [Vibrio sp. 10N.286.48.B7]